MSISFSRNRAQLFYENLIGAAPEDLINMREEFKNHILYKPEQGAPYRQRQQYYGRIESHSLTHDFRCEDVVAYALAYYINQQTLAEFGPESHLSAHR